MKRSLFWLSSTPPFTAWLSATKAEGRLAGCADIQPSGYIDQFFVAAELAGQGVGAALMRRLHEVALSNGVASLSAHVSLAAQPFFARFGFVVESEQFPVVRGVALRNAVMRKPLPACGNGS